MNTQMMNMNLLMEHELVHDEQEHEYKQGHVHEHEYM
jgi:hypothetical protein